MCGGGGWEEKDSSDRVKNKLTKTFMETDRKESFTITLRKININHNVAKKDRRKKGKLCKHSVNASQT